MADDDESEELVMIAEKARALLSRAERQVLSGYCTSYLAGAMSVQRFVDALQRLLPTPDKATFLFELRELVRDEDASEYDNRVFALKRPLFRSVHLQSDNGLHFESTTTTTTTTPNDALLQAERHRRQQAHFYFNPIAFSETQSTETTQPPSTVYRRPRFRSALQETRVPMTTPDMASAFPIAASTNSAFSRVSDAINKETASAANCRSSAASRTLPSRLDETKKPAAHAKSRPAAAAAAAASDDGLIEVVVPKTSNILGIAIEGGVDTRHHLPRIISIDGKGTAFEAAGLRIGQTIIQVDGTRMEGLSHHEAARFIASSYADRTVPLMKFILSASTFRPNANYQPEN